VLWWNDCDGNRWKWSNEVCVWYWYADDNDYNCVIVMNILLIFWWYSVYNNDDYW